MKKTTIKVSAALLLAAGLGACAQDQTRQDNSALEARVAAAEKSAADAQAVAARAQQTADQAMSAAQQNNQKVDRAFKKSQQK